MIGKENTKRRLAAGKSKSQELVSHNPELHFTDHEACTRSIEKLREGRTLGMVHT